MDEKQFGDILKQGESISTEFKRCKEGAKDDTYVSISSMLNRWGGDIFLGVEDDGTVSGVPKNSIRNFIKNIITMLGNPEIITPTVHLFPELFEYKGEQIIHIHVPESNQLHSYKGVYYDRIGDADIKMKSSDVIALMFMRKLRIHTEETVYPTVTDDDLRYDLFPKIRQMAMNRRPKHPWEKMTDKEIIQSSGLYSQDPETKEWGYNLAAVLLLGKDNTIKRICAKYRTDALLMKVNTDRYDDRLVVTTNLIDSFDLLMEFAEKHLLDKFYVEDDARLSLRNIIAREMIGNTLMHREYLSPFRAKFVIDMDNMYTENANRPLRAGEITPENVEPDSKNPLIASFFANIGYADELGSGTRNLFKYVRRYSGKDPHLIEGDIFKTIVPLDDDYSFDVNTRSAKGTEGQVAPSVNITATESKVYVTISEGIAITRKEISEASGVSERSVARAIASLIEKGLIVREGSDTSGRWVRI